MNDSNTLIIIQIGVAIVIGVVSWALAVMHTKKTIAKKKLRYKINSLAMISDTFLIDDLKIYFQETLLPEPIVVSLHIINSGNVALEFPPIEIRSPGDEKIISLGFAKIPAGYEDKWKIKQDKNSDNKCFIELEHINPNQVVKVVFLLDKKPKNKDQPIFLCAMKDLEVEEIQDKANYPRSLTEVIHELVNMIRKVI